MCSLGSLCERISADFVCLYMPKRAGKLPQFPTLLICRVPRVLFFAAHENSLMHAPSSCRASRAPSIVADPPKVEAVAPAVAAASASLGIRRASRIAFPAAAIRDESVSLQQQQRQQLLQQRKQKQLQQSLLLQDSPAGFAVSAVAICSRVLTDADVAASPQAVAATVAEALAPPEEVVGLLNLPEVWGPSAAAVAAAAEAGVAVTSRSSLPHNQRQQREQQKQQVNCICGLWYLQGPPDLRYLRTETPENEALRERGGHVGAALLSAIQADSSVVLRVKGRRLSPSAVHQTVKRAPSKGGPL